jgi:hypothetical protein
VRPGGACTPTSLHSFSALYDVFTLACCCWYACALFFSSSSHHYCSLDRVEEALLKADACGLTGREVEDARILRAELARKKQVFQEIQAAMQVKVTLQSNHTKRKVSNSYF